MHNEARRLLELLAQPHTFAGSVRLGGGRHPEHMIPRLVEIHVFVYIPSALLKGLVGLAALTPEIVRELLVPVTVVGLVPRFG